MVLDPIDYKILEIVQRNARATQLELAAAVGLSQPSVAERLRKLEQEGIILGYAARVDARKLGKDITAFVGVAIEHPKFSAAFIKKIQALPAVMECHLVTGQDSYILKVKTENTESLNHLITGTIRTIPGVTRTKTTLVLQSVKEGDFIAPSEEAVSPKGKSVKRPSRKK